MKWIAFLFCTCTCFAQMSFSPRGEPQISVKNRILTTVNGNAISVVDVMKKMDMLLHQNYPQFADSPQARFQFYAASWRPILMEMIDTELILSDAEEKEIKLTDGEIREEMEDRFGPGVQLTLEKIGLSYDDAWKMVRKELIVRRMLWFFAQSKAIQSVSPQAIRQAYKQYLTEHPPYEEWSYRVITLKSENSELAEDVKGLLATAASGVECVAKELKEWESAHPEASLTVSNEYVARSSDLSDSHRTALASLSPGHYSEPIVQESRVERKPLQRIFYLKDKIDHPAPSFDELAPQLKNELTQKAVAKESDAYMQKLRRYYGFDQEGLKDALPENLQPFALE